MSIDAYKKLARAIPDENFSDDFLAEIYYSIKQEPLGIHDKAKELKE